MLLRVHLLLLVLIVWLDYGVPIVQVCVQCALQASLAQLLQLLLLVFALIVLLAPSPAVDRQHALAALPESLLRQMDQPTAIIVQVVPTLTLLHQFAPPVLLEDFHKVVMPTAPFVPLGDILWRQAQPVVPLVLKGST
jgi:hypothetical protein